MPRPAPAPADVLAAMLRSDATRPRITCYDDATGERIELSAKTLANWVAKAANLLQDEGDVTVGNTVGLDLPLHWRAAYWALAAWSVGCHVITGPDAAGANVVVTTSPAVAIGTVDDGRYAVLVTLAALARGNPQTPADVLDEAKELSSFGDQFAAWDSADPAEPALSADGERTAYGQVVVTRDWPQRARVHVTGPLGPALRAMLSAWAADGSVVVITTPSGDQTQRLAAENVTVTA
ncbi:MAG: TIGR03089 family protein [Candidatus Phosphoribacter baldrii]|nr:TIGR03089 family protein [Dermatophilaceae bacterium]